MLFLKYNQGKLSGIFLYPIKQKGRAPFRMPGPPVCPPVGLRLRGGPGALLSQRDGYLMITIFFVAV